MYFSAKNILKKKPRIQVSLQFEKYVMTSALLMFILAHFVSQKKKVLYYLLQQS